MRTDGLLVVVIALALCAIALNAMGTDWYVDAVNGSDTTGDGSQGNPWKTLTYATSQTNQTGTEEDPCIMHIAPGVYSPSTNGETFPIEFKHASVVQVRCGELRGSGSDVTIIDAEGTYRVLTANLNQGLIGDLTITGGGHPTKDHNGGGIRASCAGGTIYLQRCVVRDNIDGLGLITVSKPGEYRIRDCQFVNNIGPDDCAGAGIRVDAFVTMTMTNCLVANNSVYSPFWNGGGVSAFGGIHLTLVNCTIVDNYKEGVFSEIGTVKLYNCIVWDNDDDICADGADLTISHCNISDGDGLGENGNISQDPLFVTGPQGDYYLSHADVNASALGNLSHAGINSKKKEKKSK